MSDTSSEHLHPTSSRRTVLLGAAGVAAGLAVGANSEAFAATSKARAKKGGNLRVGVPGNGVKDIIDGQNILTKADQARLMAGWETGSFLLNAAPGAGKTRPSIEIAKRYVDAAHRDPDAPFRPGSPVSTHPPARTANPVAERPTRPVPDRRKPCQSAER